LSGAVFTGVGFPNSLPEEPPLSLSVGVESVLTGHDDWVQSVEWDRDGRTIITSSSDKSIIIWKETLEGLWTDTVRLGIVGGQAAGFYCAVFSPDAKQIVASSYFGGLYAWIAPRTEEDSWSATAVCSGHVGAVRDLAWHPEGIGEDKTTRVYVSPKNQTHFIEVGRPQVHGHSMQCIATVSESIIVTGAEEKIFRAFEAPQTFVNSVCNIGGFEVKEVFRDYVPSYYGARVPALGLSNKAVEDSQEVLPEENGDAHWEEGAFQASPAELFAPPTEDCLQQNTLWPEIQKLYGHGYEVYAIAANPTGTVLATSCKASQAEDAVIVLWNTSDWSKRSEISGHQLTVTQIEWSPDGSLLLSLTVSLMRSFGRQKRSTPGSYGRVVILWECSDSGAVVSSKIKCPQPATSVAVGCGEQMRLLNSLVLIGLCTLTTFSFSESIVAVGLQNGSILLLSISEGNQLEIVRQLFVPPVTVDRAILRLRFNPADRKMLAVAGSDGKLRILKIEPIKLR
ncbi:WD domain, G-beta repeat protein, partial [Ancylostoma duodenale]